MISNKISFLVNSILYPIGCVITKSLLYLDRKRNLINYGDYFRSSSLELISREIYEGNIPGDVAELGVYRGDFASMINIYFPDRKLYLFDTFEGFSEEDSLIERKKKFSNADQDFSDVSIEKVLKKMKHKENIVLIKGRFPDSLCQIKNPEELIFSFVSLDVDLYQPTKSGLEYFYPRLVKGGFIFIHDYNNKYYKGVKEAVREFCKTNEINFFPLSDSSGTAIIIK